MCVIPGEEEGRMKSSILLQRNDRLQAELDSLYALTPNELAERWRALYLPCPRRYSRTRA